MAGAWWSSFEEDGQDASLLSTSAPSERQEQALMIYLDDAELISYFSDRTQLRYMENIQTVISKLERLEKEPFATFLFKGDDLLFASPKLNIRADSLLKMGPSGRFQLGLEQWLHKSYPLDNDISAIAFYPFKENKTQRLGPVLLFLLGLLLSWYAFHLLLGAVFQTQKMGRSALVLSTAVGVLFYLSSLSFLGSSATLLQAIYSDPWLGPNGIGLLLKSAIFLWGMTWLHTILGHVHDHQTFKHPTRWAMLYYWVSVLMLGGIALCLKHILMDSRFFFNFENSLQISWLGLVVALSILFLLLGAFLLVYTLFLPIKSWMIKLNDRLLLMVVSLLLALPIILVLSLGFPAWIWLLTGLIFLILFDLFVEGEDFNLTWLLVWAITLSAFSASLSYKYILDKDAALMQDYGQRLLDKDPLLEESSFEELKQATAQVRKDWLANQTYLQQHYEWQQRSDSSYTLRRLSYAKRALIEQFSQQNKTPYLAMNHIGRYEYVVLENGQLLDKQREVVGLEDLNLGTFEGEDRKLIIQNNRLTYVQKIKEGKIAILQRTLGSYFKPLSLFAVFFVLLLAIILIMVALQTLTPVLPPFFYGLFQTRHSLQNRIQLSIIGIILASSIVIAVVTIFYFKSIATERKDRLVLSEMETLKAALEEGMVQLDANGRSIDRLGLEGSTQSFALYNRQGALIYSKLPQPIVQQYMPPSVLEILKIQLLPYAISRESQRQTIFNTINGPSGSIESYIAIPFSYSDPASQLEINNFVGSIFSLYVFFMFIAGGVAIWVANSITEPINAIGRGLRQLKLGSNTPLVWKNEDEIGLLIQEYNQALDKLEDSTRQLRLSEREGAWREMAKQVAHEIKNPLTPMKLSVQHLLRAYQMNPDEIGPLLKRVSATLVEQIEGLTKIANEFSNFAKMPKAEMVDLDLASQLASVVDLFRTQESGTDIQLSMEVSTAMIRADKDQLIRVFNNLMTNAIQAIPDDRQACIEVSLIENGKGYQVRIKDNGQGIAPELQEKVFYPNFTTKSSGTGIGLSMSRNIIEQFGGRIYFETIEKVGTTFIIDLDAA